MEQNDQKGRIGCFIFFVLFVIGNIIYMVRNTSSDEFAQTGQSIFFIISAIIVYFIFRAFTNISSDNDKKTSDNYSNDNTENKSASGWVVLLVVVVLLALLVLVFNAIGTDYETNVWFGKIFWIIIAIIAAAYFWINYR